MDNYNWQYVLRVNTFATQDDVINIEKVNEWDLLITFKDGKKVMYDTYTNYHSIVFYNNVNEITEEQEKKEFAYRIRSIMNRKCISQEELAKRIDTSQTMVNHYVNGRCIPNALVLRKIAKALNCSMDDFFYKKY